MIRIVNAQLAIISGACEGAIHYNGVEYGFNCPEVTQPCLDAYLIFAKEIIPRGPVPISAFRNVLHACGGPAGVASVSSCLNPVIEQITQMTGY